MLFKVNLLKYNKAFSSLKYINRNCSFIFEEAREKLRNLKGGLVHLNKDERLGIATITIDHEKKRNAISGSMMVQFEDIVNELECWKTGKGVILKSKGDFFCSGGDLSQLTVMDTSEFGLLMSSYMHNVLTRFYNITMVTVALIQGKAIGGGAELTTITDFRLFSSSAEIIFVQAKMGLVTGWGGGTRLVKLIGAKNALDLLISCRKLKSDEALKLGFADKIINANEDNLGEEFLHDKIKYDHSIVRAMKQIVISARDCNLEQSLINERKTFSPFWGGPANVAALKQNIKHN